MPGGRQDDHDGMAVRLHQHCFGQLRWRDQFSCSVEGQHGRTVPDASKVAHNCVALIMNPVVSTASFQTVPMAPTQHEPAGGQSKQRKTSVHDQEVVGKTFGQHSRNPAPQERTQKN